MPGSDLPTHLLAAQLTVPELYILLGYAWYQCATNIGQVQVAHSRMATACKAALRVAGEPDERIYGKLQHIMLELGMEPSK